MKRILVVDDEPDVRAVMRGLAEEAGFEVVEAEDGEEALALAVQYLPDVVVLDVMMPVADGFEVFRKLREDPATAQMAIVMLTSVNDFELGKSHSAESMAEAFREPPPDAFLEKPIDPDVLRGTLLELRGTQV
jgi:CheY-like chemotaxis protein